MSHHDHHGLGGFGVLVLIAAIAYAFGPRTARVLVGGTLLIGFGFFAYAMFRVVTGTI